MTFGKNVSLAGIVAFVMALCAAVPGLTALVIDVINGAPVDSTTITAVVVGVAGFIAAWVTHENTSSSSGPTSGQSLPPPPAA